MDRGRRLLRHLYEGQRRVVVEVRTPPRNPNILADEIIVLTGTGVQEKCPHRLRRIFVWDAQNAREIVLLTNHIVFGATTIGYIYKERWKVGLFFKAPKNNLHIKSFVETIENELRIHIRTALLAMLLLKWLHHLSRATWSLSNLAAMLRINLVTYRDLRYWLDDPFRTSCLVPRPIQLDLKLA